MTGYFAGTKVSLFSQFEKLFPRKFNGNQLTIFLAITKCGTLRWKELSQWAFVESNREAISNFTGITVRKITKFNKIQISESEHYLIVSGHGRFTVGDEERDIKAGDVSMNQVLFNF